MHWFLSLEDARYKIEAWREEYNSYRPHRSLGGLSPDMFIDEHVRSQPESLLLSG